MSGLEVLGAGAAGVQLFETAIRLFKSVNEAYKRHKELTTVLSKYRLELERIRDLYESVKNEKGLKGPKVSDLLSRLKGLEVELCYWLAEVDPVDKKQVAAFAEQLIHGKESAKKLDHIMQELSKVKEDLLIAIGLHQTRMSYDIRRNVKAALKKRMKSIRVGPQLEEDLSTDGSNDTRPTQRLIDAHQSDNTEDDSSTEGSTSNGPALTMSSGVGIREVEDNVADEGSTQINAPLGEEDRWKNMKQVSIKRNTTKSGALMVNYWTTKEGLALAREEREALNAEKRKQQLFEKEHGLEKYWVPPSAEASGSRNGARNG